MRHSAECTRATRNRVYHDIRVLRVNLLVKLKAVENVTFKYGISMSWVYAIYRNSRGHNYSGPLHIAPTKCFQTLVTFPGAVVSALPTYHRIDWPLWRGMPGVWVPHHFAALVTSGAGGARDATAVPIATAEQYGCQHQVHGERRGSPGNRAVGHR